METQMTERTVIIAGATGLVGKVILDGLLADPAVVAVHCLGRRKPFVEHPKLMVHVVDFSVLPRLPRADEVYLALGTTIKVAGSQENFRKLDFDANLAVAKAALDAGASRLGLVSAMGADAASSIFYNRVKGELEDALTQLPFTGLVIARPSLLVGDRKEIGQPVRSGELLAEKFNRAIGFLIPANYKPIEASKVAAALLALVSTAKGKTVLFSGELKKALPRSSES